MERKIGDRMEYLGGCGHSQMFVRKNDAGESQLCSVVPGDGQPPEGSDGYIHVARDAHGQHRIVEEVRFNAVVRSRPTTNAYRSGWDGIYGKKGQAN